MQANRCKHVRTFLIGYRSGGTPCVFASRGACWNCGPSTREQCLSAPRQPPGSSCCLSLLAGGFRPTTQGKYFSIEWYFDLTTRIFLLHDYFPTDKVEHFQNTRSFFYDVREINSNSSVTIYRGWLLDWCIWLSPLYFDFWLFQIILIQK